ncbi:copper homeostasis membrane protein CopD [Rhizobium paknamense]|uniref:Copper resistance protein D n=1 Tax=Rhizobium paknamense TaxID=1206817 RepID=A0ABU0IHI9_9HYPH|nr:copper homeostasis membrane protein CopD [Rhizobium paknamense]MDQ0456696.1 putative copper resistance protein D [Rhizobium paknamense]
MNPDQLLLVSRFAFDTAALLLWGGQVFLWLGVEKDLARHIRRRLQPLTVSLLILLALAGPLRLLAQAASLGAGWRDVTSPAFLGDVIFLSAVGRGVALQAGLGVVTACLWALLARSKRAIEYQPMIASISFGLVLASLALTGHAGAGDGWEGLGHQANHILHLLMAGGWLGGLVPVLLLIALLGREETRASAAHGLMRFSTLGHGAVALTFFTGFLNVLLTLGGWPFDFSSAYQQLFWLKVLIVSTMAVIAIVNRYVIVPAMGRDPVRAARWLARGSLLEIVLGLAAIATVTFFSSLEPMAG